MFHFISLNKIGFLAVAVSVYRTKETTRARQVCFCDRVSGAPEG